MGTASSGEWIAILLYFALVIGVGVYFFFRDRHQEGEKEYFLGGRHMGPWVTAMSAQASDMSAWRRPASKDPGKSLSSRRPYSRQGMYR